MAKDKWSQLTHKGPYFAPEYDYIGHKIKVANKEVVLDKEAEEAAYFWAQKLATDYVKDSVFQKNFWKDFKKLLPSELKQTKFPADWDFTSIYDYIQIKKEEKKNRPKEEKKQEKEDREARKAYYGKAILNGKEVDLGNYAVEIPGLFMGRGKHPSRGSIKRRIQPEDVVINCSLLKDIPEPPDGHKWKDVIENKNALETCWWVETVTGARKRVLFGATSSVKQSADKKKFEKAIQFANNMKAVNDHIDKNLISRSKETRKIATVCKLISILSIRVGDEKGEDTADTIGASSLRPEHVKLEGKKLILDFLGKDSIPYHSESEFDMNALRNIKEFMSGKNKGDQIFQSVNSGSVKEFLSSVMPGLTAKLFRTATGSTMLAKNLKSKKLDKNLKPTKKLEIFIDANLKVAKKLNHQSAVSDASKNSLKNMNKKLNDYKKQFKVLKASVAKELEVAKEERKGRLSFAKNRYLGTKYTLARNRIYDTYQKKEIRLKKRIVSMKNRIDALQSRINIKKKTMGVALGTSKTAYIDPRIPISWAKDNDVEIKKIYPATAQARFDWALSIRKDFYKRYPKV